MSDTHTKIDIDLRLEAAREVAEMLGDMAKLIGRVRAVLDRLMDELETLADGPHPNPDVDSHPSES